MKKHFFLAAVLLAAAVSFTACNKTKDGPVETPDDPTTITEIGTANGAVVRKTIGVNGGQLVSADGTVTVTIPAGALAANKEISIQPVTNKLGKGVGNAYRILPHGDQFSRPVSIVFNYKSDDLKGTLPELLDVAYQDADGSWLALTQKVLDKGQRKISVTTMHFSDWGFFKSCEIVPFESSVEQGASVDLKAVTTYPYVDPDLNPGSEETIKVLKNPRPLKPHEIKKWTFQGEGFLIMRNADAYYTAPDHEPRINPEVINCNVNLHRKGQFILLASVQVMPKNFVKWLKVDEDDKSPLNNGSCRLYIYGAFGMDPGQGKRVVKIGGTAVEVDLWAPQVIRCKIDRDVFGGVDILADGKLLAKTALKKYSGSFQYTRYHGGLLNAGSSNALKESTTFKIVYRGFGAPKPADLDDRFSFDGIGAFGTRADYTLRGSASVSTPVVNGCVSTTSVTLPDASGTLMHNTIGPTQWSRLKVATKAISQGIEVKIDFLVEEVVTGVRVKRTSSCGPGSLDQPRPLSVALEGFSLKAINLAFSGADKLVLMYGTQLTSGRLSSGILIEAWDGTGSPSHYESDGLVAATFKNW